MTAGMAEPSFLPIRGSSGLTRRSTSSDSSPMSSTAFTLTSSASSSSRASRSASSPPGRASHSRASGWRTLSPAWPRRVRTSSTARRVVAIARLEPLIPVGGQLGGRPAGEVDAVGRRRIARGDQVVVDRLAEERQDRGHHPGQGHQRGVERGERRVAIARVVRPREPPPRPAQVPRRQVVDGALDEPRRGLRVVVPQPLLDPRRDPGQRGTGSSGRGPVARPAAGGPGPRRSSRPGGHRSRRRRRRSTGRGARGGPRRRHASRTGCCRRVGRRRTSSASRRRPSGRPPRRTRWSCPQLLCIGRPSSPRSVAKPKIVLNGRSRRRTVLIASIA